MGFACGHIFHLSHVNPERTTDDTQGDSTPKPTSDHAAMLDEPSLTTPRTVGPKVTTARLLRDRVGGGCRICALEKEIEGVTGV